MLSPRRKSGQPGKSARERTYLHAAVETMPREKLAKLQLDRLRATLANAYTNVPLVHQRLDKLGVKPADIRSLADLASLPFTVKTDLRDQYPFGLFARPAGPAGAAARIVGHHRQAHGGRLHPGATSTTGPT